MRGAWRQAGASRLAPPALVIALLSTLVFWPTALDRWVLPKVLVLGFAALLAVATPSTGRVPRWLLGSIAGTVIVLVISALANGEPVGVLLGEWPRFEGVLTAGGYLVALLIGARLLGPESGPSQSRVLDRTLAAGAVVLGLVSALEAVGLRPIASDLDRPGALLGNATDQGAVAAAIAVVLIARLLRDPPRRLEIALLGIGCFAAVVSVFFSGSRAALAGLIVGVLVVILTAPMRLRVRLTAAAGSLAGMAALALIIPATGTRLLGESATAAGGVADRLLVWGDTMRVVLSHSLLGTGPGGFLDAVAAEHDVRWFTTMSDGSTLDSPHNVLLQALVIGGPAVLAGAVAVLVAVAVTVVRRVRHAAPPRTAIIIAASLGAGVLLLVLMTHVSSPATVNLAALLVGAAIAVPPRNEAPAARVAVGIGIAVWIALVTSSLIAEVSLASGVDAARSGRVADSDAAFDSAAALRPWDARTVLIGAEALTARVDAGDADALGAATRWSDRARAVAPGSLAAGKTGVTVRIVAGDLDGAAAVLVDLRSRYPLDPWVAAQAGAVAAGRGDLRGAEELLLDATVLDPDRAEPWLTLAYVYEQTGDALAAADARAHAKAIAQGS